MLTFLTTRDHAYTFSALKAQSPKAFRLATYEWLFDQRVLPAGAYVFCDIERLTGMELFHAGAAARHLREAGQTVLNDPAKVRCRAELLAALHQAGINRFRCYHAGEAPRPERFPVLLKSALDHAQGDLDLYANQSALDARLEAMRRDGMPLRDILVIEFCAIPVRPGIFRKFSVFRVGDRILPVSGTTEDSWAVKAGKHGLATPEELEATVRGFAENPHEGVMRRVFDLASIDYGRSDFGILPDGIAVYEVNTNPAVPGLYDSDAEGERYRDARNAAQKAVRDALLSLPHSDGPPVEMPWAGRVKLRFGWIGYRSRMKRF